MMPDRSLAVRKAQALRKRFKTSDPFEIAGALGVEIRYVDSFQKLKGMYTVIARNRFIFLNGHNGQEINRIVCAHELGHDQLHRKAGTMRETDLWDISSRQEYEANLFAAHLLLSDDEMLSHIAAGKTCAEIAAITETDPNLVALKVECLMVAGHALNAQIYENRFLK